MKYWINVVSKDHLKRGIAGSFMQANHGKASGLKRLQTGDGIVFYSPKTAVLNGEPLQAFTAIGRIKDDQLYQVEMTPDFVPWRRNVRFQQCLEVPIKSLINKLDFITDKTHWGYKFRFGLFEIAEADFRLIADAMIVGHEKPQSIYPKNY